MSEKPYKLGRWFWGRMPELPDDSAIIFGGHGRDARDLDVLMFYGQLAQWRLEKDGWWCIISDTPPLFPEPELRLPEGYRLLCDEPTAGGHILRIAKGTQMPYTIIHVERSERAECVRVIQAAVDAMEVVE